uniref:BHLH domain-containing protein n=1 Tax=Parascaris equorum TaxID=6256 RepID=A0A914R194_PAREQ
MSKYSFYSHFLFAINKGFDKLRLRLPTMPYEKKLSKMDTLKQAIEYIQQLSRILEQFDQQPSTLLISSTNGKSFLQCFSICNYSMIQSSCPQHCLILLEICILALYLLKFGNLSLQ